MQELLKKTGITGGIIPEDANVDVSDTQGMAPTGFFEGFGTAVAQGFEEAPTTQSFSLLNTQVNLNSEPKHLSEEEWKDSPWFRKGLTFNKGVDENIAETAAARFDKQTANQDILNNMKPGIISDAAKLGGTLTGFLLDPINLAIGALGGEAVDAVNFSKSLPEVFETTRVGRISKGIARGAAEGAIFQTPGSLARFEADNKFGQQNTIADVLSSIGAGAALGGILRGFQGMFRPVNPDGLREAEKNAINQVAGDRDVNAIPSLKEGYNEEIEAGRPLTEEEREAGIRQDQALLNDATTNFEKEKSNLASISKLKAEAAKIRPATTTQSLVSKIIKTVKVPETERTSAQQNFLDRSESLKEVQDRGLEIGELPEEDQAKELKAIKGNDEIRQLKDRIDEHKQKIKQFDKELNRTKEPLPDSEKDFIQTARDLEAHRLEIAENRENVLEKKPSLSNKVLDAKVKTHRANMLRHDAKLKIHHSALIDEMFEKGKFPETKEALQAAEAILNSPDGLVYINPKVLALSDEAVQGTPKTSEEAIERNLNLMRNVREDDPEISEILEDQARISKELDETNAGLEKLTSCITGKLK